MIEILRKFENQGNKIARVQSILIANICQFTVIYFNFVRCWCPLLSKAIFSVQYIYREVYALPNEFVNSRTVNSFKNSLDKDWAENPPDGRAGIAIIDAVHNSRVHSHRPACCWKCTQHALSYYYTTTNNNTIIRTRRVKKSVYTYVYE